MCRYAVVFTSKSFKIHSFYVSHWSFVINWSIIGRMSEFTGSLREGGSVECRFRVFFPQGRIRFLLEGRIRVNSIRIRNPAFTLWIRFYIFCYASSKPDSSGFKNYRDRKCLLKKRYIKIVKNLYKYN